MITTGRLAKELKNILKENGLDDPACRRSAYDVILALLLESIGTQQREVYDFICERGKTCSTDLMERFGWEQNHCGNLLKKLHDWGLLKRHCDPVCYYRRADL